MATQYATFRGGIFILQGARKRACERDGVATVGPLWYNSWPAKDKSNNSDNYIVLATIVSLLKFPFTHDTAN